MPSQTRIDAVAIRGIVDTWRTQPGYAEPRVKDVVDGATDKLVQLAEEGDRKVLLSTIRGVKAELKQLYTSPLEDPPPGTLPALIHSAESYANLSPEQMKEDLEKQYNGRLATMRYFGIIDDINDPKVKCIDNVERKAPTATEIWQELSKPENSDKMEAIKTLKNPKLIVTPLGMPLATLSDKVASQNGRLKKDGQEMEQNSVYKDFWDIDSDKTGEMIYFPQKYEKDNHGGKTKQELLESASPFPGWQVVFVEGEQEVQDTDKTAPEFLEDWKNKNYDTLTNEDLMMLHTEGVVSPFGDENEAHPHNRNKYDWALGTYLPNISSSGFVPRVFWHEDNQKLYLYCLSPDSHYDGLGARRAVRVF